MPDITAAAKRAGLKGLGLHDLRRHFLNKLRSAGIPLDLAVSYTAHKDISTVMAYYREASAEQLDEAARQFDANERRRNRAVP